MLVSSLLLVLIVPFAGIRAYRQLFAHFPSLASHSDMQIVDQTRDGQLSLPLCLIGISERQALITNRQDDTLWERLPIIWKDGPGNFLGYHHEAYYEREIGDAIRITSSVFFHYDEPYNEITVKNRINIQLPKALCNIVPTAKK